MTRPSRAAAIALCAAPLAACRPPAPPPEAPARPADLGEFASAFAAAERRGAGDGALDQMVRSEFAAIGPEVSVEPLGFDELAPVVGRSTARRLLRGWVVTRATLRVRRRSAGDLHFDVALESEGRPAPVTSIDGQHLSLATGEAYPAGESRSRLRVDAPLPLVVLTGGIMGLATLRIETSHLPPAEAQVRAAIPRALRLAKALEASCSRDQCTKGFIFRRPADESARLELGVSVAIPGPPPAPLYPGDVTSAPSPIAVARLGAPLAEGDGLEARLRKSAPMRPDAGRVERRPQEPEAKPCVETFGHSVCEPPVPLTPWPLVSVGGLGLSLPPRPPALGTPAQSAAQCPAWAGCADTTYYAPFYEPPSHKMPPPSPGPVEGGLLSCRLKGINVPGEDADKVTIHVALDRPRTFYTSSFTAPLVRLAPKRPLRVSFFDRDFWTDDDFLAELTLRREGGRLVAGPRDVQPRRASVDFACEVYDRDAVEAEFESAYYAASDALEAAEEGYRVAFGDGDFGFAENGALRSRAAVANAAALVGWGDRRVMALVERVNKFEAGFYLELRRALEHTPRAPGGGLVLPLKGGDVRIKPLGARCEAEPPPGPRRGRKSEAASCPPCAVEVEIENESAESAPALPYNFWLVFDDGRAVSAPSRAPAPGQLPPGERVRHTLEAKRDLNACSGRPWALLRTGHDAKAFGWATLPPPP